MKPRDFYLENKKWLQAKASRLNEQIAERLESELHHKDLTF
jgi:hypothetical protein